MNCIPSNNNDLSVFLYIPTSENLNELGCLFYRTSYTDSKNVVQAWTFSKTETLTVAFPHKVKEIPTTFFHSSESLKNLWARGGYIEHLEEKSFADAINLKNLSMASNKIRTIHNKTFETLANIEYLHLQQNFIEELDAGVFEKIIELRILRLDYNQIQNLPENIFKKNENLKEVNLSHNKLKTIKFELPNNIDVTIYTNNNICNHTNSQDKPDSASPMQMKTEFIMFIVSLILNVILCIGVIFSCYKKKNVEASQQYTLSSQSKKDVTKSAKENSMKIQTKISREHQTSIKNNENLGKIPIDSHYESLKNDMVQSKPSDSTENNALMYATLDLVKGQNKRAFAPREETLYAEINSQQLK